MSILRAHVSGVKQAGDFVLGGVVVHDKIVFNTLVLLLSSSRKRRSKLIDLPLPLLSRRYEMSCKGELVRTAFKIRPDGIEASIYLVSTTAGSEAKMHSRRRTANLTGDYRV